ncbi:hypothetical protein [Clostridium sp. ZBS12]|uniref:hypothetical protein n=1 Tax=Clostridium sp. ZBS12 TaxID=2949972 RepID=UPI00207ACA4B|nr:hypothetical protein [Clostridium sp. ZBS12]
MIKMNKKRCVIFSSIFIIVFIGILLVNSSKIFTTEGVLDYSIYNTEGTTEITGEITNDSVVRQKFINYIPDLKSIEIQVATFNNRMNNGNINVKVTCEDNVLANKDYDISKIGDGEYINLSLDKNKDIFNKEILIDISSNDSKAGEAITLWMGDKKRTLNTGKLFINGIQSEKTLNMKLNYKSPKLNYLVFAVLVIAVWIMIPLDIYKNLYYKYIKNKENRDVVHKYVIYFLLIVLAFSIISLRDLSFITEPTIYAEDGVYITNIFNNGLINSMFGTRGGTSADFQNTGSYILLYMALILNKLFNGYDLSYLPTYIGIVSNLFFAIVALLSYIAFKPIGKRCSYIIFFSVVLIPTGRFGAEIFGRTLNTVFIWPVLTAVLLMILYKKSKKNYLTNIIIGIICLLSCLSFPISYGIVGIYLCYTLLLAIINSKSKIKWVLRNSILLINIVIGIYLLPTMINSKGITETMQFKKDSLIEFAIARHILYPFIPTLYRFFNDTFTIIMFSIYACIVLYAMYLKVKKSEIESTYFFIIGFTIVYWVGSVVMRIKMTSLFNQYQSSFPDRYFYGCNILSVMVLVYALEVIFENFNIKEKVVYSIQTFIIVAMLINPYVFGIAASDIKLIGGYNKGIFNQCILNSMKEENFNKENSMISVDIYPKEWKMDIPYIYVFETTDKLMSK